MVRLITCCRVGFDAFTIEPSTSLAADPAAQNPGLAPNPGNNIHGDSAMTDAYTDRTPVEWRNKLHSNVLMVLCALAFLALCVNEVRKAVDGA